MNKYLKQHFAFLLWVVVSALTCLSHAETRIECNSPDKKCLFEGLRLVLSE